MLSNLHVDKTLKLLTGKCIDNYRYIEYYQGMKQINFSMTEERQRRWDAAKERLFCQNAELLDYLLALVEHNQNAEADFQEYRAFKFRSRKQGVPK